MEDKTMEESKSWFSDVAIAPAIEVFALTAEFKEDNDHNKVNLGVGAYRDDDGKPWVLPVVRSVEGYMAADHSLDHEYLGVAGNPDYRRESCKLLLGSESEAISQSRTDGIQTIGGTGAIYLGLAYLKKIAKLENVYVSSPTWGNHKGISKSLGYNVCEYRYWDNNNRKLDFEGFKEDLENAPEKSVILLHMCAHNPTGIDPTAEQWAQLAKIIKKKQHFPFFDCAYQGFSSGDLEADPHAVRAFVKQGFEIFAAQSFSKNFGLYNERVGNLCFVCNSSQMVAAVRSQMMTIVRQTWSNSPNHGSRIVASVLNNSAYRNEWKNDVKTMANRILLMRQLLSEKLKGLGTPGSWDHITTQTGMFAYTGLNEQQVEHLKAEFHIYLLKSGRINVCALTTKNVEYVANAIHEAVTKTSSKV